MAQLTLTIVAQNPGDFEGIMQYFGNLTTPPQSNKPLSTTSSNLDARYNMEQARAEAYNAGLRDSKAEAYNEGLRDAKAEAAQERVMSGNNKLAAMLEHDEVMVCLEPNRAPFAFRPLVMAKERDLPKLPDNGSVVGPADCVGMYGLNLVTQRHIFFVRCDHWTLCPPAQTV